MFLKSGMSDFVCRGGGPENRISDFVLPGGGILRGGV